MIDYTFSKVLLCRPTYYDLKYSINPWMNDQKIDNKLAENEFESLVKCYEKLGVKVGLIQQDENLPDMVFTANAGLMIDDKFMPSNFRYEERQGESNHFEAYFSELGKDIIRLPENIIFEGAGDALYCGDRLFIGYGFRSQYSVKDELDAIVKDSEIIALGLSNPYFYHLDTCFSPLPSGKFIYYPDAFDDLTRKKLEKLGGYWVTEDFCVHYGCNMIVVGELILTSHIDDRIREIAKKERLAIQKLNISEYIKTGGGVRCLSFPY